LASLQSNSEDSIRAAYPFIQWTANLAVYCSFSGPPAIGRAAKPEEVAGVIAFLASEVALFVNGVILSVDGASMRPTGNRISSRSRDKADA